MQQVIVDFGQVQILGQPLALRIYGGALLLVLACILAFWWRARRTGRDHRAVAMVGVVTLIAGALGAYVLRQQLSLRIYGYGLMMVLGFVAAIWLAWWRARRAGENHHAVATVGLLALIGGVLGARLAFVLEVLLKQRAGWPSAHRIESLADVFNITSGGLIYYGGAALATGVILLYLRLRKLPVRRYLDIIAPSLMIGLAFGRMGCLLNGCCYGGRCRDDFLLRTRFPYASTPLLPFDDASNIFGGASISPPFVEQRGGPGMEEQALPPWIWVRDAKDRVVYTKGGPNDTPKPVLKAPSALEDWQARKALAELHSLWVQPAQAFGIFNALLLTGLLLCFSRLRRREGQVFALMLILYPMTRIVLESIRGDNPHDLWRQLTHNQKTSLAMTAVGLLLWLGLRLWPRDCGPAWRERLALAEVRKPKHHRHRKGKS